MFLLFLKFIYDIHKLTGPGILLPILDILTTQPREKYNNDKIKGDG